MHTDQHRNRGEAPWARPDNHALERIAFRVSEAIVASGIGRTKLYEELKAGRLRSFVLCGRRLILREDLLAWLRTARDGPAG